MLVDGQLIEADSGKTFDNVNPATEEVLGQVAHASKAEMRRAIDAARRAFDETKWSTDRAFRDLTREGPDPGPSRFWGAVPQVSSPRYAEEMRAARANHQGSLR